MVDVRLGVLYLHDATCLRDLVIVLLTQLFGFEACSAVGTFCNCLVSRTLCTGICTRFSDSLFFVRS
jgi:hypothetical protein